MTDGFTRLEGLQQQRAQAIAALNQVVRRIDALQLADATGELDFLSPTERGELLGRLARLRSTTAEMLQELHTEAAEADIFGRRN